MNQLKAGVNQNAGKALPSRYATDVQQFIADLDGGVFMEKVGQALSDVAAGAMDHQAKGQVSITFEIKQLGTSSQMVISHKLSYKRPTARGDLSENNTTQTPMHISTGGKLTLFPLENLSSQRDAFVKQPGEE